MLRYLVSQNLESQDSKNRILRWSAENGQLEIVKFLVSKGADISTDDEEVSNG